MAVMPVSALILSYVLLDESFQWIHLAGFGLALAGVLLMSREHQQQAD
jgi:drug/metabolite transporter (DMT)-like permease